MDKEYFHWKIALLIFYLSANKPRHDHSNPMQWAVFTILGLIGVLSSQRKRINLKVS